MLANTDQGDLPDAVALWRSLRDFLKVDVEVVCPQAPSSDAPATVKFVVTNVAPIAPDWPEIVFEGISLGAMVHNISNSGSRPPGELSRGQSFAIEVKCRYKELPSLALQITGSVSRQRFFQVNNMTEVPLTYTRPTILSYLTAFNAMKIHTFLDSRLKGMQALGPDTKLADIQKLLNMLSNTLSDSDRAKVELNDLFHDARPREGSIHEKQVKVAFQYLTRVSNVCVTVKKALSSANAEEIAAVTGSIVSLESEAAEVDRATEELMRAYNISDEEAGYKHR